MKIFLLIFFFFFVFIYFTNPIDGSRKGAMSKGFERNNGDNVSHRAYNEGDLVMMDYSPVKERPPIHH